MGALICVAIFGGLSACSGSDELKAENAWPLTQAEPSTGGVELALQNGAQWTEEGLLVDGSNYATTPAPGPVITDSSFTISAWVRPSGSPAQYTAAVSQSGDVAGAFFLGVAEGFWAFSVKPADGNGDDFVTNRSRATEVAIEPDVWVHLTGIYDSELGRARLYLNGYPADINGTATESVFPATGPLLIGAAKARGQLTDYFTGTIADVKTWPQALTEQEVQAVAGAAIPEGATLAEPRKSVRPACPNAHGGICLGELSAGTYTTEAFEPTFSYTVPDGWVNGEDLPGNFLLYRTSEPPVAEGWGSSYIGIFQNVLAADQCVEEPQAGVGQSSAQMAEWYRTVDGLQITKDEPISLGGLSGISLDLQVDDAWESRCPLDGTINWLPMFIGGGVSQVHHVMGAPLQMRLIILNWNDGNVVVETTAVLSELTLEEYLTDAGAGEVIESFTFAQ